ncbi:MAG: cytochrome b/b6 domain-containing protein [Rhodobacteraceae bacterium]|nr:cytochrome b/b6 domain-containing protein [Paracoccaceae bacterium]
MPNPTGYLASQIWLHWLVALLIIPQFLLNESMGQAWRAIERGQEVTPSVLITAHVVAGVAVLALVLWRLVLRLTHGAPPPPASEAPALQMVGKITHGLLYLVLALLTVSGGMAWFGGIKASAGVHEAATSLLLLLVSLHVLGALYHQFVLKTNLLARMKRPG